MACLQHVPLSAIRIEDETDYTGVPLYAQLKQVLLDDGVVYRVATAGSSVGRWDHVLLLNLAYWTPGEPDDILESRVLTGDVIVHRAWHHLAHRALGSGSQSVEGLMLGEAVASAFDVYLMGCLLQVCPQAAMLDSQVPAMSEVMGAAGRSDADVAAMFEWFAASPRDAFRDLVQLIYQTGVALCTANGAEQAAQALLAAEPSRMFPLLHHFQFPSWVLFAKAYASSDGARAASLATELLYARDPLQALVDGWL